MRLLLSLILFLSAGWIGLQRSAECRREPLSLLALADSLAVLQSETCVRRTPLPAALLRCSNTFSDTKYFYQMLLIGIQTERPISEVWYDAAMRLHLGSGEARHALLALGEQIGRYDAQTQETAFVVCIESLRGCASQIGKTSKINARLAIGLSAVCGLLLAIVCY